MRSIEEILRTYNVVNSRSGSRYTLRFLAAFLLAGVFVVAGAMLLTGGPERTALPGDHQAAQDGEDGPETPAETGPPFATVVREQADGLYVGYPLETYDPAQKDRYDRDAINAAVVAWLAAHPETALDGPTEPVYDPAGDRVLMGYLLHPLEAPAAG